MKIKNLLPLFLILIFGINSLNAQSLEFVKNEDTVKGSTKELLTSHVEVKNITDSDVTVKMTVEKIESVSEHTITFCDVSSCYQLVEDSFTSPPFVLNPDSTTGKAVHLDIIGNGVTGTAKLKATFFNADNTFDKIEYTATFYVGTTSVNDIITNNFSAIAAPNPAIEQVRIDYTLPEGTTKSEIKIFDASGNFIKSQKINPAAESLNFPVNDMAAGSYYYVITADGESMPAQNLVIVR